MSLSAPAVDVRTDGRRRWWRWRAVGTTLLLVLPWLGMTASAQAPASAPGGRPLVVGSEVDFPPLAVGRTDETASGFTVELWRWVAERQQLQYTIRVRPFDELLQAFRRGEVDVLLNLAKSDDRRRYADFSATHVVSGGAVFARNGETRIVAESDLAGRSLVVLKSDLAHDYAIQKGWTPQLVTVGSVADGLRLVAAGRHDAMLVGRLVGMNTLREAAITGVRPLDIRLGFEQRFAFAIQKGDADLLSRLNEGLALAKAEGVYDDLYDRWLGPFDGQVRVWSVLWPALSVAAGAALVLWGVAFRNRLRRDRRNAEELRASEERWKFALDGAGDGVWDTNLVTAKTLYSRRWKEILGHAEHEIGDSMEEWTSRIHPDDRERVLHENRDCIDGRADGFVSEFRMRTKDGRWVWVMDRGKVVERAPDGRALRMIGTHTDITARKRAQSREATRARVMLQIATGGSLPEILRAIVLDVESRTDWRSSILLVDESRTRLVAGAAPSLPPEWMAAIEGLPIGLDQGCCGAAAQSKRRVVCEDVRDDFRWVAFRDAAQRAGLLACWSEPILATDGSVLGTLANYRDRVSSPTLEEIEGVVDAAQMAAIAIERRRDLQALRESEALLSAKSRTLEITLERMEQGVMMVNADRIVEVCNRRAMELLDLPPALMASRPTFAQVLQHQWSTDEFAHTPEDLREFVRSGGILDQPQRYERLRPNGRVVEVQSVPIEGGGVLRTYTDVTERRRAESLREALEAQLLEARKLEAIGTLAGGIAHDFNNVLAAILGNAALAREDLGPGHPSQAFLDQITKAGQRARSLVQQILAFSRQQPSEFTSVTLAPLIDETVSMLRTMAGPAVRIESRIADPRLAVRGDPTQLQQVLMNLGTNAWHALRGDTGRIGIELDEREVDDLSTEGSPGLAPGRYAHLCVRDDGVGMDDETRRRIFEPFFTTKPVGQGTGLGLAVVHGIVRSLAGAIEVDSAPGEGSTFELWLPLVEHESRPMPLEAPGETPASGRGQRILYVDDDEVMAVMVQGLLGRLGYAPTCVLDAQEAIDLVRRDPSAFDLVVTDFNMPRLSGLDVARALVAIRPGLPVVISTGFASDELRAQAAALGVRAVMQKERTLEELGAVVGAALAG